MDVKELEKISKTREQIREVYDRGPEAVEDLVLSLVDSINYLIDIVKDQEKKILKQEERIKDLEDLINKNSRNSNKPPSSDSPFKNTQVKKNKKKGEQKKRSGTTLKQVSD